MKACANISASLVRSNNPNEVTLQSNNATFIEGDANNKQNAFSDTLVTCPLDNCAFSSCSLNGDMFDAKNLQPILRERCGNIFIYIVPKIGARSIIIIPYYYSDTNIFIYYSRNLVIYIYIL